MEPISYEEFRTGLTYYDVYHLCYTRKWKRRGGVLGAWRELKQKMYAEYLRNFDTQERYVPSLDSIPE